MFKAIKNGKIVGINETGEFPLMNYDSLEEDTKHKLSDYVHCDGRFVLTDSAEAIALYKQDVRTIRNNLLEQSDKYLSVPDYPITEEREQYKSYRQYLRDYPDSSEEWFKSNPMTFEEWSTSQTTA